MGLTIDFDMDQFYFDLERASELYPEGFPLGDLFRKALAIIDHYEDEEHIVDENDLWSIHDLPDGPEKESVCDRCSAKFIAPTKLVTQNDGQTRMLVRAWCDACCHEPNPEPV